MTGDALEQALALQRAPLLRFSLRDRPLAPGITRVIQLAAASQPLLADTAARLGLTEDGVLEAVRFYLQQVLFEGEPEAYRSLGAAPAASTDEIREHFRWLQRWLHPDRASDDGFAPFAAKLNWAWQQLRNEHKRSAYDVER
ncbi:MAG TPA: DnaJ domain-containing protein, partial [Rhodanobacteraceae bacterium]|nr:DnaJ domain-containing protein [Rhodanobacteraceae bacterium]